MEEPAISIRGVTKTFGSKTAVRDFDLVVPRGSLCGFIGPNGAGKTTTIRMVMSIIFPDRGEIRVLGRASAVESKDRIGYLPEERGVYRKMKVGPFLHYMARLKGLDAAGLEAKVRQWLARVGLGETYGKKCEELSKGMQQKVQFVASVIHEPDLIILDEPFSGLDPVNRRLLRELIDEQHAAGRTLIFSTHAMSEAEALCDRVVMVHRGLKVLDEPISEIIARFDPNALVLDPAEPDAAARVGALPAIESVRAAGSRGAGKDVLEARLRPGVSSQQGMAEIVQAVRLRRIEVKRVTLEDVFVELVGRTGDSAMTSDDLGAEPAPATLQEAAR